MAIYLKLDGVDGESVKDGHEKWIEVLSFSWGAMSPTSVAQGGGLAAGTVSLGEMNVVCASGKASLLLLHFLTKGKHFGEITVDFTKATGEDTEGVWWQIKSTSGFITSYSNSAQGGDYEQPPSDSVTIALGEYTQEIWEQKTEGGALESCGSHGFDIKKKKAS